MLYELTTAKTESPPLHRLDVRWTIPRDGETVQDYMTRQYSRLVKAATVNTKRLTGKEKL